MRKFYGLLFCILFSPIFIMGQAESAQLKFKNNRQLRHRVLHNTDHGYFGVETGSIFDFSTTQAVDPADNSYPDPSFAARYQEEFIPFLINTRLIIGYKWKSHYFELGFAGYRGHARLKSGHVSSVNYGALQFGYYYQLPIQSNLISVLLGPEIGWVFKYPGVDYSNYQSIYYYPPPYFRSLTTYKGEGYQNFLVGFSSRIDFKMAKNLTLFIRINFAYIYQGNHKFVLYYYNAPTPPPAKYFTNQIFNLNFSFGLKFDFYSQKKKQQTYDALGIEDPYKK